MPKLEHRMTQSSKIKKEKSSLTISDIVSFGPGHLQALLRGKMELRPDIVSINRKIDVRTVHSKFSSPEQNENDTSIKLWILNKPLLGIHHHGDIMSHFRYAN